MIVFTESFPPKHGGQSFLTVAKLDSKNDMTQANLMPLLRNVSDATCLLCMVFFVM